MNLIRRAGMPLILSIIILILSCRLSIAMESRDGTSPTRDLPDRTVIRGIELLYDGKFDEAEILFEKVVSENPEDPIGYFYMAMVTWSRMVDGFWSVYTIEEYQKRIEETVSVAQKRIENGRADSFTYFYLGGALGFSGRFQLMQHKWFASYTTALKAIDALKTCLEMDPDNRDVLLGLGIYDYYTARFSGVLKFLTYIFFHRGDTEEGLRKLHIAADEAIYSSIEAKSTLLHIYLFMECDFKKALPIAEELARRFQNLPKHAYLLGITYIQLGMDSEYGKTADCFRNKGRDRALSDRAELWANRGLYLEAGYYLFHDQYDLARSRLEAVTSAVDSERDPLMAAWPILKMGMSHDLEGKRRKALEYYDQVMNMQNGAGAQFLAEKYSKEPITKGDPFILF